MVSLNATKKTKPSQKSVKPVGSAAEDSASPAPSDAATDNPGDFSNFSLCDDLVTRLRSREITHLFPVQVSTYRPIYKGKDVITQARTGSGKTLSFVLPVVSRLLKNTDSQERGRAPTVIVLAPTRELAVQIYDDFKSMAGKLSVDKFYGGQQYEPQENALRRGIDILVGTPGRILDLCDKGKLILNKVKHVILDEADRMLEIGFKEHMDQILSYCTSDRDTKPQMLLFSATMPTWVQEVASKYMHKPKNVNMIENSVNKTSTTVNHLAIRCLWQNRNDIIGDILQQYSGRHGRAIIFTQTKVQANELSVSNCINQDAQVLHGDIPQSQRELRLQGFRDGKFQCLVATDVAARGLDIPQIDLVVQCEPPKDVDSYIHRSGRTGRAGRSGTSVCLYNARQEFALKEVEKKAGIKFARVSPPQPHQLIKAAVDDASRCLEDVPSAVLPNFTEYAKELLAKRPAEEIVAAALSYISGLTEIKTRSLLSSEEGYVAYQMANAFEVRSPYFFWNSLESILGAQFRQDVKFLKLTKDKMGCVIDVPAHYEEYIADTWQDTDKTTLFKMTELPELEDYNPRGFQQRSYGNNNNYRGRGQSNGYRNNFNGGGGNYGNGGGFKRKSDFGNGGGFKRTKY